MNPLFQGGAQHQGEVAQRLATVAKLLSPSKEILRYLVVQPKHQEGDSFPKIDPHVHDHDHDLDLDPVPSPLSKGPS